MSEKNGTSVRCSFCDSDAGYRSLSRLKAFKSYFCSVNCEGLWKKQNASGKNHSCWINGYGKINNYGYKVIRGKDNKLEAEQRLIASKVLGRKLKSDEIVHHINGNKLDNRNKNLLVCSRSYHALLHNIMSQKYQEEHFGPI